jgi:hypothetical protein
MSLDTPDKPDVIFTLSVDTEEEWDWAGEFPQNNLSVSNVRLLPKLQDLCGRIEVRPIYFTDYAAQKQTLLVDEP